MSTRQKLTKELDSRIFQDYYYLKEELVAFCRENRLPTSGNKEELTKRITMYLEQGIVLQGEKGNKCKANKSKTYNNKANANKDNNYKASTGIIGEITLETLIEPNFVCSEQHRAFFKDKIGKGFSFKVAFQKWLKTNTGKSYAEAIEAYYRIVEEKKKEKTTIDRQFEYNTYIRDFFEDNKGRLLNEAIQCWKYKKALPGHNRYERSDLKALV